MKYHYFVETIELKSNYEDVTEMHQLDNRGKNGYELIQVVSDGGNKRTYYYRKEVKD